MTTSDVTRGVLAIDGGAPVRRELLPYGHQIIDDRDVARVSAVLRSDWLTTGPAVEEFESAFASTVNARHAVAVSSGTAALHAAAFAAGIADGDEVITTPMTFAATANAVRYAGGTVVFADCDPSTLNVDPQQIERRLTPRTRAIAVVDYAGLPCDLDDIRALAAGRELVVIEDAAHALGATYRGRRVGSLSDMTTFSLHPVKQMTTGEGGVVTTNDDELARRLRLFRNHGITSDHRQREQNGSWFYEMVALGYNYRITDIQCALGTSQLERLGAWVERRREIARMYREALGGMPEVQLPPVLDDRESAWHLFVIQLRLEQLRAGREQVFRALRAENIGVNVHYIPVPWHPYYQALGYRKGEWPIAESAYERLITLPLWAGMTDADTADVIAAVRKVIGVYRRAD
jgi:UDP-4-amino-4,6-dideoxy-N-acetyl-beta-L-altrosamine transaminase